MTSDLRRNVRRLHHADKAEADILAFPPRRTPQPAVPAAPAETRRDFRHRMLVNAAGFGVAATLAIAGIWLAFAMADQRVAQDCALMGVKTCRPIAKPSPTETPSPVARH